MRNPQRSSLPVTVLALSTSLHVVLAQQARINLPSSVPKYAKALNKDFFGLSIESDLWPDWAGQQVGQPNQFVQNALANLQERTGYPVSIRVGANSEDTQLLGPSGLQVYNAIFPTPTPVTPYPEATSLFIGQDFFALSSNFPQGTDFTWGINLRNLNLTETVGQAQLLSDTFYGSRKDLLSKVNLKVVEIGNEPDFYSTARGIPGYDVYRYNTTWSAAAAPAAQVLNFGTPGAATFQIGTPADYQGNFLWTPTNVVGTGILDAPGGQYADTWSQHLYFGARTNNVTTDIRSGGLMSRSAIRTQMSRIARYAAQANDAGLKFVIGEGNSVANHGQPGVSDAGEAAVWMVDYGLLAASFGTEQIFLHEGVGFAYNLIQPVPVPQRFNETTGTPVPKVQMSYYGALVLQEAIGTYPNTKVVELTTNSSTLAAYGIWEDQRLARAVIINSNLYNGGNRTAQTVSISGWNGGYTTVKRLYVPTANSTTGVRWAGQSFETSDAKPTGDVYETPLTGSSVTVNATEVVLLCFK